MNDLLKDIARAGRFRPTTSYLRFAYAVQVLPALALVLSLSHSTERRRVEVVALGATGYACLIASTMAQTYDGRRPLDLGVVAGILALIGLGLLAASALIALRGLAARTTAGSDA